MGRFVMDYNVLVNCTLFQGVSDSFSFFCNFIKGNFKAVSSDHAMHLKNLFTSLLHGEFRSIQLTSIFKLKPFTVDGVIKAGIRPLQGQILSVSELPGGLFCCDFRFRTNNTRSY